MTRFSRSISLSLLVLLSLFTLHGQSAPASEQQIRNLKAQAGQYLQKQQPKQAIPIFRQILSIDPQNLDAEANLGVLLFLQGSYEEAIQYLRAASAAKNDLWR